MVTEGSLSRVVKALVSKVGPRERTKGWLVDFSGLSAEDVDAVLRWLKARKHARVLKSGKVVLEKHAKTVVQVMVNARQPGIMENLDDPPMDKVPDDPVARHIFLHYHECMAVRCKWDFYRNGIPNWAIQPASVRSTFVKAARSLKEVNADVMEYVQAQFVAFDKLANFKQEKLLPQPRQLIGANAQQRYMQFKTELEERVARQEGFSDEAEDRTVVEKTFSLEEQRLKALAAFNDTDESTILKKMPTQFSREFLKHKGVWKRVKDAWLSYGDTL